MKKYQRIRDLREDEDLKQWQVAEILKTNQTQYQRYESGEREIPAHMMIELAKYYNVSLDYIAGITNDKGGLHCNYLTEEEKNIIQDWKQLNSNQKRIIKSMINECIEKKPEKKEKKSVI